MEAERHQQPSVFSDRAVALVGGGGIVMLGMLVLLWIVFGDFRTAAIVVIVFALSVGLISCGMFMMYLGNRAIIERLTDAMVHKPPEIIDANYSLAPPAPRDDLVRVDDAMMVRQKQIETTAIMVYTRMYPHTAPTRDNIKEIFGIQSHGFIAAVQAYLRDVKHVAEGGGQGREYMWMVRDE